MVGQDPATLVDVMDVDVLPAQSARDAGAVQPQRDQVAVKVHNAAVPLTPVPVEGHGVAEASGLHELLPLEKHRDAGGRQQNPRGQGRALLGVPPGGIPRVDLVGEARLPAPASHVVMRFGVDDALEGVMVEPRAERVLHGVKSRYSS